MVLETDRTCRTDPFGSLLLLPIYALEGIRHTGGSGRQAGWEQSGCHIPPDRHSQHYNGCGRYWSRCRRVDWLSKHERWRSGARSEEHTYELQSLMRISYAVFCLKKKKQHKLTYIKTIQGT